MQVTASKGQECWPVGSRSMSARVLAKRQLSLYQGRFNRRKHGRSHVLLPQQLVDRTCANRSQKHSLGIDPAVSVRGSARDEDRTRRAECDQFMGIDRQVSRCQWPRIFQEVARHPVIFARPGDIPHLLAEYMPVELGSGLS